MHLDAVKEEARICAACYKMCRHVCTVGTITCSEADLPNFRAEIAWRAAENGAFTPSGVERIYRCCTCGLCQAWCEPGWDVAKITLLARRDIVEMGMAPQAAVTVNRNVIEARNPHGQADKMAAVRDVLTDLSAAAETLVFFGCNTLLRQPEIALAMLKVLRAADIEFTVLTDEPCCGEPQRLMGFVDDAVETARATVAAIATTGARRVIFTCPSCLRLFSHEYAEWGVLLPEGVELLHVSQFLEELLARDQRFAVSLTHPFGDAPTRAVYHDPCMLGRCLGEYDAPRRAITAVPGVELVELQHNRERALCCGAGGGLAATDLRLSIEIGKKVVNLAAEAGAGLLVTACPTCKQSFARHAGHMDGLGVMDLIELVAAAWPD